MVEDLPLYAWLIVLAVLILLSAFFAGTETALMALNRYRLRHLAKAGHRGAQIAEKLLSRPDRLIGMILLGNIAVHSASAAITTFLTLKPLIEKNREAFAAMIRAMLAMRGWLDAHSGAELARVVADYYPGVAQEDLAAALTRYKAADIWMTDTRVSRQGFDRLAASLLSGGFISRIPAYEDCVADAAIDIFAPGSHCSSSER